jgi:L-2-hydroxyglutarate oxidase LhgO
VEKANFVICGAGINGLTIARELLTRGHSDILIFEKEPGLGLHASGRNSGVLHAGVYYAPGSLKAATCLEGNRRMKEFCRERKLPLLENGKVIVARDESELPTLHELHRRAATNGARVELIDEKQLNEIEPAAKTVGQAMLSHDTAVVDPKRVLAALAGELTATGKVKILHGAAFLGRNPDGSVRTSQGSIGCGFFINAAGAHADTVARAFGAGSGYMLVPFKGIYKKMIPARSDLVRGSIYPVPNIKNPFLGVHFTRGVHGDVYLGPTAIPALGRENYKIFDDIGLETLSILWRDAKLFLLNAKFRGVAMEEPRKYSFSYFFKDAAKLVKHLDPKEVMDSPKSGIRPQLVNLKTNELVMDFVIERKPDSLHILNAISPAFTSSLAFSEMVVREYLG